MESPLLNITEAAGILGVSRKTLYRWIGSRYIPFIRIGRLIRFRERDLEEWVEGKRSDATHTARVS